MALRIPNHDFVNGPPLSNFQLFNVMDTNPHKTGLLGSYFLGGKSADPTYNYANPDLPLLVHGNPDVSDPRFAKLSRLTGYFDTQLPSTTSQTIVALCRQQPTTQQSPSPLISNYLKVDASNVSGDSLMKRWRTDGTSEVAFYAQTTETAVTLVTRGDQVAGDKFNVVGGVVITSGTLIGAWSMNETSNPGFNQTGMASRSTTTRPFLIGSTYSDTEFTSYASISAMLIYEGDIKGTPMTNVMNWLRNVVGVEAGIWTAPKS
ncbi:hypothetical protein [Raoultella planticola]|uniref:hypothetical protein n=1 Tax=Raoultella planticola TaxID=575 RepID=UPI003A4D88BB